MRAAEVARLAQALEAFSERPPQGLPESIAEKVTALTQELNGMAPGPGDTPGRREAAKIHGGVKPQGLRERVDGGRGGGMDTPGRRQAAALGAEITKAAEAVPDAA